MYTIHPITCGVLTAPKDGLTYRFDRDVEVAFPVLAFVLTADDADDETTVLVDTGVKPESDPYMRGRGRSVGPPGGGPEPLRDGLAEHGLSPSDVDTVVLSHLHHDHSSNNDLFPDAEFLVHREELAAARDPLPVFRRSYPDDNVGSLDDLDVTVVECDYRLREGIELLHTPGHTQGQLSIVVETAAGPHALVGDLVYVRHNLEPGISSIVDATGREIDVTPVEGDYIPPGIHTDVVACYESMDRIRRRIGADGTIVPGHDPRVMGQLFPADTK